MKLTTLKLTTLTAIAALCLMPLPGFCTPVIIPASVCTDDTGAVVAPTSVSVTSVTDLDGNAVASSGAAAHEAGPNLSVVYDAAAHGEAWITLTPVLSGHTFNTYAKTPIFASVDSSNIAKLDVPISSRQPSGPVALTSASLLALEQGIFGYTLAGTTFGDHVVNSSSTLWGGYAVTYPDAAHQATTYSLAGTPYVSSALTLSGSKPVSKTTTTANQ